MEDNTRRRAFRPTPLEQNTLLHRLTPWSFARLLDHEASWLLRHTFPIWAERGDLLTRAIWTQMCRDLLLETGELIEVVWKTLHPEGEVHYFSRYMPDGLRLVVGLTDGTEGQKVQAFLGELVFAELRRERVMGEGERASPFTFMDVMREEYEQTPEDEREDTTSKGVAEAATTIASSWMPALRDALRDKQTWRLPMPPSRNSSSP